MRTDPTNAAHTNAAHTNAAQSNAWCDQEAAVIAALDSGALDAETTAAAVSLAAHVRGCAVCQEAIDVWRYLQQESETLTRELDEMPLRHPGLIWWRRRILDQQAAAHRLLQPIAIFQIAAGLAGLLALTVLLLWLWPSQAAVLTVRGRDGAIDLRAIALAAGLALAAILPLGWAALAAVRGGPLRR